MSSKHKVFPIVAARDISLCLCAVILVALWPGQAVAQAGVPQQSPTPPGPAAAKASTFEKHPNKVPLWRLLRQNIKYVFVIYQENRSFDSYFGTFPGADGLFSQSEARTPGFHQPILDTNGTSNSIHPFRIGPQQQAADTDDVDHSHSRILAKMNVQKGVPQMDRFALTEERKWSPNGNPSLAAKQFAELTMAYEDCDTIPILWRYAHDFVLFDHIFQLMIGPSTPGNLSIIAAQTGVTQWLKHPDQAFTGDGEKGQGVPVLNDDDPYWGSPLDHTAKPMPVNPKDFSGPHPYEAQRNLTFATLPLSMEGKDVKEATDADADPEHDLADVAEDIKAIMLTGRPAVPFRWYEEGYDHEPTDPGPTDAEGRHASYITHHNGPQYFGYVANNPKMRAGLHGLNDFFNDLEQRALPPQGGLFFVKGGYQNIFGLKPANPDSAVQRSFLGDDDHPGYSDAHISEAMVAQAVNKIALSPYWSKSAIMITWDDSEGDYDHVRPPLHTRGPKDMIISDGPRVPLILISPYVKTGFVAHARGNHASVVKFVNKLFNLRPLALLPDELRARQLGQRRYGRPNLGPADALTAGITDLSSAFSTERLTGKIKPLSPEYALIPEDLITKLPPESGYGCDTLHIIPLDRARGIKNEVPPDFNPRPRTNPTQP